MKKRVLFVASFFAATAMFAQGGLTSKKGEVYLPEAGDYAIGFDGLPFIEYAGNLFNGATSNTLSPTWVGNHGELNTNMTLYGKMFKDETTAYRGKLRIGLNSTSEDNIISDTETNTSKTNDMNVTVGAGMEHRRGNTRVQGFYGAEALLGIGSSGTKEEYGLALDANNTNGGAARTTETKNGSTFAFGARAFAGVEWFVAPKVSIAAEYGWGLAFSSTGEGEVTTEAWDGTAVVNTTTKTGGSNSFGIDTDNNGGALTIFFHF